MYRAFFLSLCLVMMSAQAAQWQSHEELRQKVHEFVKTQIQLERGAAYSDERVKISVSNLDSRLRLASCSIPVATAITSPPPYGHQITTKVSCQGEKPWSIYLPVKVDVYAEVAVASRSLTRGTVVGEADIEMQLMNTAQAGFGYAEDPSRLVGMSLKRGLTKGDAIRLSHLAAPRVISKGDKVMLEARGHGVSVVASGTALAHGRVGEQIRVRNVASNRVVDATVVAPGRVEVVF